MQHFCATKMGSPVNSIFRYMKTIQTEDEILKEKETYGIVVLKYPISARLFAI